MPVRRTTCEHEAQQRPYPQSAWFYLLKAVACSATVLILVPKTWFHGKLLLISNKLNHMANDMAKKAGPGPCWLVPKGPRARRKSLEREFGDFLLYFASFLRWESRALSPN
ncbi:hypothetical protein AV530_017888 [Patagioenas fasciata monilis]|uniref:Uncharacterized protein n=1 Tax=Patagioenas fasciata monilis TaxID=372326 RepID=A0A1V4JW67_PATFA|nr:hypothetical protein AV530_017888 [Patagioenas fasciata monilis]